MTATAARIQGMNRPNDKTAGAEAGLLGLEIGCIENLLLKKSWFKPEAGACE
jgi:hypothetical protein